MKETRYLPTFSVLFNNIYYNRPKNIFMNFCFVTNEFVEIKVNGINVQRSSKIVL